MCTILLRHEVKISYRTTKSQAYYFLNFNVIKKLEPIIEVLTQAKLPLTSWVSCLAKGCKIWAHVNKNRETGHSQSNITTEFI